MKSGSIILIEDDIDDRDIFSDILKELQVPNVLNWFDNCNDAFAYLKAMDEQPFIIFSDVNLPGLNGIDFKRKIDEDPELRRKSIPFIFYSTSVDQHIVNKAYTEMTVQGFFQKKSSFAEIRTTIKLIIEYWHACTHPNTS